MVRFTCLGKCSDGIRYKYPEFDFSKKDWKKVSVSQDLSDILVEGLKEE